MTYDSEVSPLCDDALALVAHVYCGCEPLGKKANQFIFNQNPVEGEYKRIHPQDLPSHIAQPERHVTTKTTLNPNPTSETLSRLRDTCKLRHLLPCHRMNDSLCQTHNISQPWQGKFADSSEHRARVWILEYMGYEKPVEISKGERGRARSGARALSVVRSGSRRSLRRNGGCSNGEKRVSAAGTSTCAGCESTEISHEKRKKTACSSPRPRDQTQRSNPVARAAMSSA